MGTEDAMWAYLQKIPHMDGGYIDLSRQKEHAWNSPRIVSGLEWYRDVYSIRVRELQMVRRTTRR